MRRLLTAALTAVLLIGVFAAPASAYTVQGASCASGDVTQAKLWEGARNGLGDADGDLLNSCGNTTSLPSHTLPGYCDSSLTTWNNCASAITVYVGAGYRFCVYDGTSYGGTTIYSYVNNNSSGYTIIGNLIGEALSSTANNKWSSHRWIGKQFGC